MPKHRLISRSERTILLVLAGLALVALLLPTRWTGKLSSLVQILVPFQDTAANALAASGVDATPVSPEQFAVVRDERDALMRARVSLFARVAELEDEVDLLTATRVWGGPDMRMGSRGMLIPADIVVQDLLPWRSSRLINAGSLQGISRGAAVTSATLDINRGEADGVRDGLQILLGETFIGTVERVMSHTARVRLLSDRSVEMKARLGRATESGLVLHESFFWLTGLGDGQMRIADVDQRAIDAGSIALGDLVLSDHQQTQLPAPMIIGRVTAIDNDRANPLLATLTVRSEIDVSRLKRVYVFDPASTPRE